MASFMGVKWGESAKDFLKTFKYADKIKRYRSFYLLKFPLGDIVISEIFFIFYPKGKEKVKFKKKNYDKLFFKEVSFHITPDQYDELFDILKIKYGEPFKSIEGEIQNRMGAKFLQKEALWIDTEIDRMIYARKYSGRIDEGRINFMKYDPKLAEDKDKKKKKAADQL